MANRKWGLLLCVMVFIIVDVVSSSLLLGVDGADGHFSFLFLKYSLGQSHPQLYSFTRSLVDFWFLALARSALIMGVCLGALCNPVDGPGRLGKSSLLFLSLAMFMAVWSPIKLLAVAELPEQLEYWAFWVLFSFNMVASVLFYVLFSMMATIKSSASSAQPEPPSDDRALLLENENVENGPVGDSEPVKMAAKEKKEPEISRKESFALLVRLLAYCKSEWAWYLAGFVALFLYSIARIFVPFYTGEIIADIVLTHSYSHLLNSLLIMGLLTLVSSLMAAARGGAFTYGFAKFSRQVRDDLFVSLAAQEMGFFDSVKTGEIISRLTADCQTMSDTVALNINVFLRNFVMFFGSLIFMFQLNWRMTLLTFIFMPLITIISKVYGAYYDKLSEETQETIAKANEVADEVLGSMRTVRSFANELGEGNRYRDRLNKTLKVQIKQCYAYVGYIWMNEALDLGLLIAALWYGGHLVLSGKMLSAHLISFLLYQLQLGENLQSMGMVFTGLMQSVGASRKVFEYIDRKPEIPNDGTIENVDLAGKLEFKDVCFSYPTRPTTQVLNNVSFTVSPGETVALVGPSGGGKSSCISLLEHFYEPSSGQVLLDGVSVSLYSHHFYHKTVSLVSQEPTLYARSIHENIYYGLDDDRSTESESQAKQRKEKLQVEAEDAAKLANAHGFVTETPDKYETQVGEKGVQLSGGQKQRIAIARALMRKPKVLLLDEATSALDAESEHLVQQALYDNLAGHTVLLIAHRLSTVERADRIVVINGGKVVQTGNHQQLLQRDGLYKNLVQRQLLGNTFEESPPVSSPSDEAFQSVMSSSYKSISPLSSSC